MYFYHYFGGLVALCRLSADCCTRLNIETRIYLSVTFSYYNGASRSRPTNVRKDNMKQARLEELSRPLQITGGIRVDPNTTTSLKQISIGLPGVFLCPHPCL